MNVLEIEGQPQLSPAPSASPGGTPGSGRFRVDRISSFEAGHSRNETPKPATPVQSPAVEDVVNFFKRPAYRTASPIQEEGEGSEAGNSVSDLQHLVTDTGCRRRSSTDSVKRLQEETAFTRPSHKYSSGSRKVSPSSQNSYTHNTVINMCAARRISSSLNPHNITRRKSSVFIPSSTTFDDDDEYDMQGNAATIGLYGKSLHNYTVDALPKMDNYRNLMSIQAANRPTLDELHDEEMSKEAAAREPEAPAASSSVKFGWIEGCLVRCLLNIWGVMLFLRLSWMVAQSGIIHTMIIITFSTVVTAVTTLSMSAASTNGEIKGGGIYYMISRSLGPEFGGAIGVVFSFANSAMAALNIVGFSESMISLLHDNGVQIIDGAQNDNRIISCVTIVVLQSIIIIGMEWEAKAQMGLLVILLVAMGDFIIGAFMGPQNDQQRAQGWLGLNGTTFLNNLKPAYAVSDGMQQDFFSIFSIFFPAVSGIQAGVSISGDLKDPAEAIPKGTLLAIFITSSSYALFALLAGAGTLREATGNVTQVHDGSFTNCTEYECKYGMYHDYNVMGLMSIFGPLIYAGCFAACLSSALSCLVSGPKTFQALCKDKVYPYLTKFGVGYGKSDDPYYSYAIGFVIAIIFIIIADLNSIAPLISNFFMAAYALLNYCTFHASLVKPLGWRPTFKYYNTWLSLFGAIICVVVMFLMSWVTALISMGCVVALYSIVLYRKPELNWGTSIQAQTYSSALNALQSLATQHDHVKNYRPQILCLSGFPSNRPVLVEFAYLLTKKNSLLLCANVNEDKVPSRFRQLFIQRGYDWLRDRNYKGFYVMVDGCKFDEGCNALLQSTGIGKLAPNIVLMGYKNNWQICEPTEVQEYFNCLHASLDNHLAIAILRVGSGLDVSDVYGHTDYIVQAMSDSLGPSSANGDSPTKMEESEASMTSSPTDPEAANLASAQKKGNKLVFSGNNGSNTKSNGSDITGVYRGSNGVLDETSSPATPGGMTMLGEPSLFETKQGKGTIDVYWLYDDGGLTLLLPYIITMRKKWSQCQLRVFAIANKTSEAQLEYRSMAALLSKFRIDYSKLTLIPEITRKAHPKTKELFDSLIKDFTEQENKETGDAFINEAELLSLKEKTNRHLRLRELLLEHSTESNLIVMTLPVPRKGVVSAFLYMAWLEILTKDMPPFLLVRGNQASVLTFYS